MKNYIRATLPGLFLITILAGAFWANSPRNVQAETPDPKIPAYVKGKQFTIDYGNGDRLVSVSVVDVILVNNEPWWKVALPTTGGTPPYSLP